MPPAIDGVSSGYRVIVPLEARRGPSEAPHQANLFDIDSKYGDVMPLAEVLEHLEGLSADPAERRLAAAAAAL